MTQKATKNQRPPETDFNFYQWLDGKTSGMSTQQKAAYTNKLFPQLINRIIDTGKKNGLTPVAASIVRTMLERLRVTPWDERTKATILMLNDEKMMAGHRAEVERFLKSRFYWNQ